MNDTSIHERHGTLMGDAIADAAIEPSKSQLQTSDQQEDSGEMFIRLARDPNISVEKIERLMTLWERQEARRAKVAFNAAMNLAQQEMEPVRKDAYNKQTSSKYASFEALDEAVRPIYTKHGFGLSYDTGDAPNAEEVRMLCYVSHTAGHDRTHKLDLPADGKGAKGGDVMTRTHATVSATSYGQRALLRMIFNIAVGGDDDGNKAGGGKPVPPAPEGYDAWFATLEGIADNGEKEFEEAWAKSKPEFRKYLSETAPKVLAGLKTRSRSKGRK